MSDRTTLDWSPEPESSAPPPTWGRRAPEAQVLLWVFAALAGFLLLGNVLLSPHLTAPALRTWSTIFVSICVQAVPFLVCGVALSSAITAFVPPSFWAKVPRRPYAAPVPGTAVRRALAFLPASPAVNPVVLVATAVAFPGHPDLVLARFAASLVVSVLAGWIWQATGRPGPARVPARAAEEGESRWAAFLSEMRYDLLRAGGFLVIGGLVAATLNVVVPRSWLASVSGIPWLPVLVLAVLAVVLSLRPETDAFVAASLTGFSPTARLVFLVAGPMVDLTALRAGAPARAYAVRFVPPVLTAAVLVSVLAGRVLL
ncbi:permease [Sphaerisporangium corydalis]|uniref:Permease n=1 Tax=Sphaerisporangium corydalis TaxID=1441875 RepID=A0ABV9EE70_9ACTN|nr:permease [Sphaerisporangium corydalis]